MYVKGLHYCNSSAFWQNFFRNDKTGNIFEHFPLSFEKGSALSLSLFRSFTCFIYFFLLCETLSDYDISEFIDYWEYSTWSPNRHKRWWRWYIDYQKGDSQIDEQLCGFLVRRASALMIGEKSSKFFDYLVKRAITLVTGVCRLFRCYQGRWRKPLDQRAMFRLDMRIFRGSYLYGN